MKLTAQLGQLRFEPKFSEEGRIGVGGLKRSRPAPLNLLRQFVSREEITKLKARRIVGI